MNKNIISLIFMALALPLVFTSCEENNEENLIDNENQVSQTKSIDLYSVVPNYLKVENSPSVEEWMSTLVQTHGGILLGHEDQSIDTCYKVTLHKSTHRRARFIAFR